MGAAKSALFALHRQYFDKKQIVFHAGNNIVQLNSTGESSPSWSFSDFVRQSSSVNEGKNFQSFYREKRAPTKLHERPS